ncbi:hypothetical protein D3C78_1019860 [compost metagenome]
MPSVMPKLPEIIHTGSRASLTSVPGRRSEGTSIGLIWLRPCTKMLSPQFSTCRPRRTCSGRSPM